MSKELIENFVKTEVALLLEETSKKEQVATAVKMLQKLTASGPFAGKAYIAGGWVRDSVLGRVSDDIDITVEMENGGVKFAEWLSKQIGSQPPVIFENFGTAMIPLTGVTWEGVDLSGLELEFVQTRTETYTPEGGRKPQVGFGTIKDDVQRRDFTVNALLFDLTNGEIVDLVGGMEDIKNGIIRTPLEADVIFNEDPLRMLRAVRFAGRYGWEMDPAIEQSIKKNVKLLNSISRERVSKELVKILHGAMPEKGIKFLIDTGLWDFVIPGMPVASVGAGTILDAVEASRGSDSLFLAFLGHFTGGNTKSAAKSLKLSNEQVKQIMGLLKAFSLLEGEGEEDYKVRKAAAVAAKATALDEFSEVLDIFGVREAEGFGEQPPIFFSGNDLMSEFGLKPGPVIAKLISLQQEAWFRNPSVTPEEVKELLNSFIGVANE